MATIFPSNPTVGDTYNGYRWTGTVWEITGVDLTASYQPLVASVSDTELGYLDGVTSAIQTQIDGKSSTSHNHSGVYQPVDADLTAIAALTGTSGFLKTNGSGTWSVDTGTYLTTSSASSTYAPLAAPTFTGTVVLPSTTSIGNVSATELGYVDGVTSAIQTQLNAKASTTDFSNTAWTSFTPALKTNGGTITLGNGTMVASYKQIGKIVHVKYKFTIGSTTSIGANEIVFGLPVTAASSDYVFAGAALDSGNAWYQLTGVGRYLGLTTEFAMIHYSGTGKTSQGLSNSSLFSLLDADYISISGSYEAA